MNPLPVFIAQFVWFLIAWSAIAVVLVQPRLQGVERARVLAFWVAPQLFRVLGLGLVVPNLAPNLPASFAVTTAVGDSVTAILAMVALVGLHRQWPSARTMVWLCNIVGS